MKIAMTSYEKKPNDKIECKYCGTLHSRSHRSHHLKTKKCKAYQDANDVIRQTLLLNIGMDTGKKTMKDLILEPYTDKKGKTIYLTKNQFNFLSKLNKPKKED